MEEGFIIIIFVMFSVIHICHVGKGMAVGMGGSWFHWICSQGAESENSKISMFSAFYFLCSLDSQPPVEWVFSLPLNLSENTLIDNVCLLDDSKSS